jgi:uncharacterized protein
MRPLADAAAKTDSLLLEIELRGDDPAGWGASLRGDLDYLDGPRPFPRSDTSSPPDVNRALPFAGLARSTPLRGLHAHLTASCEGTTHAGLPMPHPLRVEKRFRRPGAWRLQSVTTSGGLALVLSTSCASAPSSVPAAPGAAEAPTLTDADGMPVVVVRACDAGSIGACRDLCKRANVSDADDFPVDPPRTLRYCGPACERNRDPDSCASLGLLYSKGLAVPLDPERAKALYSAACDRGSAVGCNNLGVVMDQGGAARDPKRAVALFTAACEKGERRACANLERSYREGGPGLSPDVAGAFSIAVQLCDQGWQAGCVLLADDYKHGTGVAKDARRALSGHQAACEAGELNGCTALGLMYEQGLGVAQDLPRARALFTRTCDAGSSRGCFWLGALYHEGKGVPQDWAHAAKLYERPCARNDSAACSNLAVLYQHGQGIEEDRAHAARLFEMACDRGLTAACINLGQILSLGGGGVTQDLERAESLHSAACDSRILAGCRALGEDLFIRHDGKTAESKAIAEMERMCDAKVAFACHGAGIYLDPTVTRRGNDRARALGSYRKACSLSYWAGCEELRRLGEATN